jgi:hypothetical protein
MRALDRYWEGAEQERYRKPSALLMQKRVTEAALIRRDEFERARCVHEELDAMEEREFAEAQRQYEAAYAAAREVGTAAHEEEARLYKWQRECDRMLLVRRIEKEEAVLRNRLNVLHEKPAPLESFRDQVTEPVASRPIVPLPPSFDPEQKLRKLAFKAPARAKTAMNRHSAPEIRVKSSRRSTQARSEQGPHPPTMD